MTFVDLVLSGTTTAVLVLAAMAIAAAVERLVPPRPRGPWNTAHLRPNAALTLIALATNIVLNAALVMALLWLASRRIGVAHVLGLAPMLDVLFVVVVLDLSTYLVHVAMHRVPALWRFHRVHHSDPAVDVTTTIRQHPGESLARFVVLAGTACVWGASPSALAVYRLGSVLNALFEHADLRLPRWLDRGLVWLVVTPNMHKVHHSRVREETDTNYGNIFSLFDRLFSTFTPSQRGLAIAYGLAGTDAPQAQTTAALLAAPFAAPAVHGCCDSTTTEYGRSTTEPRWVMPSRAIASATTSVPEPPPKSGE